MLPHNDYLIEPHWKTFWTIPLTGPNGQICPLKAVILVLLGPLSSATVQLPLFFFFWFAVTMATARENSVIIRRISLQKLFLSPLPHFYASRSQRTECPHGFHATAWVCGKFFKSVRGAEIKEGKRTIGGLLLAKNVWVSIRAFICKNR